MKNYILKYYLLSLLIISLVGIGFFLAFKNFDTYLTDEIESNLLFRSYHVSEDISSEISAKAQTVNNIVLFIETNEDDEKILGFIKALLDEDKDLFSIYYGTRENKMINASGWIPPEDFDLRTRPWYLSATERKDLVFTDLFLNASEDRIIMTIAKPVYNAKGESQGVVGADLSMDMIIEMVLEQADKSNFKILVDSEQEVIASSNKIENDLIYLKDISIELSNAFNDYNTSVILTTIDGEKGYGMLSKIPETNLTLVTFIPLSAYASYRNHWILSYILPISLIAILFFILFKLQKKIILEPAYKLQKDIEKISTVKNIDYRLSYIKNDPFEGIRKQINNSLKQTEEYLFIVENNRNNLEKTNKELNSTLEELRESQEEIEQQKNELISNKNLLEKSELKSRAILDAHPDLIFVFNAKGEFLDCKTNNENILLIPKQEFIGKNVFEIMPEDVSNKTLIAIRESIKSGDLQKFEYNILLGKDHNWFEARVVKIEENEVLALVRDITVEKEDQEIILDLTFRDQLTNLYNRRYFEDKIIEMSKEDLLPMAIIMIDVNGLKLTNDAFGHLMGDQLLKKVANALNHCNSGNCFVSRIGGDEFVIVYPNTEKEEVEKIVETIHSKISQEKLENIVISISAGWEIRRSLDQSFKEILTKAENCMFRKKIIESQRMRNKTIKIIMETLNCKNEREETHCVEVSKWAKLIAFEIGLDTQSAENLEILGMLHDIGKITISDELLNKPDTLTEEEYYEIKRHSEIGYHILKSVDEYAGLAEIILEHHERYDGKGYPKGIAGDAISLMARILSVADAYEAMLSDRPYRKAISQKCALEEIHANSGTQFDPEIVEAFIRVLEREKA